MGLMARPDDALKYLVTVPVHFAADFAVDALSIRDAEKWRVDELWLGKELVAVNQPGSRFKHDRRPVPLEMRRLGPGDQITLLASRIADRAGTPDVLEAWMFCEDGSGPMLDEYESSSDLTVDLRVLSRETLDTCYQLSVQLPDGVEVIYPSRLLVAAAEDWVVVDIALNNRSMFAQSGDVAASLFGECGVRLDFGPVAREDQLIVTVIRIHTRSASHARMLPALRLMGASRLTTQRGRRRHLPLYACVPILPKTSFSVTARPQVGPIMFDSLIVRNPEHWVVHEVRVGNFSQKASYGELSGLAFSSHSKSPLITGPVLPCQDFMVTASYVGPSEAGEMFDCVASGDLMEASSSPCPSCGRT